MKVIALTTLIVCVACAAWATYGQTTKTPRHEFRILVTQGRVTTRTTMVQGQSRQVPAINITRAMDARGKMMNELQNRTLRVTGPLVNEVLALQGREVVVRGTVRRGNIFEVSWIQEKREASQNIHAPTPVW